MEAYFWILTLLMECSFAPVDDIECSATWMDAFQGSFAPYSALWSKRNHHPFYLQTATSWPTQLIHQLQLHYFITWDLHLCHSLIQPWPTYHPGHAWITQHNTIRHHGTCTIVSSYQCHEHPFCVEHGHFYHYFRAHGTRVWSPSTIPDWIIPTPSPYGLQSTTSEVSVPNNSSVPFATHPAGTKSSTADYYSHKVVNPVPTVNHPSLPVEPATISSSSGVEDGLQGSLFLGQCTHNPTNTTSLFPLPSDVLALFPEHIGSTSHSGLCLQSLACC